MATANPVKIGSDIPRVDGRMKVTGAADYGADAVAANPAYGFLVTSRIARGRITALDDSETRTLPGVLEVFTYQNVGERVKPGKFFAAQGYMGTSVAPLSSEKVWHDGQIVALVVADTFEAARDGAHRLKIAYDEEQPAATFDSAGAETVAAKDASEHHEDPSVGDAETAYAAAAATIDASYSTPTQHHNPIELFSTTCAWNAAGLTIWESSQNVTGFKNGVAEQLGIDPETVRVVSPFIGGAFGSRGSLTQRTALVALAAKRLNRPVKLVVSRDQGFTTATYRAETRHRIRLGADRDGKLVSLSHEGWEVTSRPDPYMVAGTDATTRLYASPNVSSRVSIVHADRATPGFMRSPPELPYLFALESAMDELAVKLGMDPIELRRINDTMKEPIKGLPYTTRSLMRCFDAGAGEFGWARRDPKPGAMQDGDWLIGLGCAATMYPTAMAPAAARVTLSPTGTARVQTAAHDIGTGAYTVLTLTVAEKLGLPLEKIEVELGDSDFPPAPVAGGSNTTASVCNVVAKACDEIRTRIAHAATAAEDGPFAGHDAVRLIFANSAVRAPDGAEEPLERAIRRVSNGAIEAYAENIPHGVKPEAMSKLYRGQQTLAGGANLQDRIQFAFGAEFVELRVHKRTREVRCPRVVGAFAAGRIVSPRTAESQLSGGLIWGISSALHEATEIDTRAARYVNADLAEYLIPVNADIGEVKVIMLPEEDHAVNALGIKGRKSWASIRTAVRTWVERRYLMMAAISIDSRFSSNFWSSLRGGSSRAHPTAVSADRVA
jgi:xanthine dehydrogenase YagR molybdenum-binding subunit